MRCIKVGFISCGQLTRLGLLAAVICTNDRPTFHLFYGRPFLVAHPVCVHREKLYYRVLSRQQLQLAASAFCLLFISQHEICSGSDVRVFVRDVQVTLRGMGLDFCCRGRCATRRGPTIWPATLSSKESLTNRSSIVLHGRILTPIKRIASSSLKVRTHFTIFIKIHIRLVLRNITARFKAIES